MTNTERITVFQWALEIGGSSKHHVSFDYNSNSPWVTIWIHDNVKGGIADNKDIEVITEPTRAWLSKWLEIIDKEREEDARNR